MDMLSIKEPMSAKLSPVEQLLIELLRIPSESGHEGPIADHLAVRLAGSFPLIEKIPVSDGRCCLFAGAGAPKTLLAAHLDTVVGQLEASSDEENIYGRGSCDTKGSVAAAIAAGEQARAAGLSDFGLLFTIGEETEFDGAVAASAWLKKQAWRPKFVVVGEPTGLKVVTAQKGILSAELECRGTKAHSSRAERDSATSKLVAILATLEKLDLPGTLFNIGVLAGGEADNIVAANAKAVLSWRTSLPGLKERLEKALAATGVAHTFKITVDLPPVSRDWPNFPKNEVSYYTEMVYFENSVVCGPGHISEAHSADEFVSRRELNDAVDLYLKFLKKEEK